MHQSLWDHKLPALPCAFGLIAAALPLASGVPPLLH
jgi:hypothetical protein